MGRHNHLPEVTPRILVLEGLWPDTSDALRAAGANVTEGSPWNYVGTMEALKSGEFHGLVLTGGSDINPILYGDEHRHPQVYGIDPMRDEVEWDALELALSLGIPVLGICRGSQMMTAFRGGKLTQHIDGHRGGEHMTYADPKARTFRRAIAGRELNVVSLHHQCVLDPGPGMRIAARAFDGTPEAVESVDGKWLGCQFHPEVNAFDNSHSYAIFCWLVDKAAEFAGGRTEHTPFRVVRYMRDAFAEPAAFADDEPGTGWGSDGYRGDSSGSAYGWDDQAWGDDLVFERGNAVPYDEDEYDFPPRASKASPPRHPRSAGEPSLPSMRARSREDAEALICPFCAIEFDYSRDHHDHITQVHGYSIRVSDLYVEDDQCKVREPREYVDATAVEILPDGSHPGWTPRSMRVG